MRTASIQSLGRVLWRQRRPRRPLPATEARSRRERRRGSLDSARAQGCRFFPLVAFSTLCVAILMGLVQPAAADSSISFSWSPNAAAEHVAGYRFYFATHSGPPYDGKGANQGDSPIKISGNSLVLEEDEDHHKSYHFKISGLPPCATIYVRLV